MKITELQLIGTNVNNQSSVIDKPLLGLLTNYALTRVLWPKKEDSSLFKKIWTLQKYCPMISVYGNLLLNPGNFMNAVCPLRKSVKCDPRDIKDFLADTMVNYDNQFSGFVQSKFMEVTTWIVKMNGRLFTSLDDSEKNLGTLIKKRQNIIINGIKLCQSIKRKVKQIVLMHNAFKQDLNKDLVNGVIHCIEMMKSMEEAYINKSHTLNNFTFIIEKY